MDPNLESAIRSEILGRIPQNQLLAEDVQYLLALRLRELLSVFFNWRNRFVSARPRTVHRSNELMAKNRPEVEELAKKIEAGRDLSPHLSTGVQEILNRRRGTSGRLSSRRDVDLLLNDWGIYHLHLSDVDRGDGFVVRTGDLLFVAFRRDDAYLLDVLGHGAWTNESLVEIATINWPEAGLFSHFPNMTLEFSASEDDRKKLRDSGINTPVPLSSGGFASGPGITRGGTSGRIELQINKLWNSIALDEEKLSHSAILDKVRNALEFHPFSDR
jgi:hypothetical protein